MTCNFVWAQLWAEQASTLIAELKQEISLRQLQLPTQQLQLPEGSATRKQLHLEPAPLAQEPAHKNFRHSKAPQPRLWMELDPCRLPSNQIAP